MAYPPGTLTGQGWVVDPIDPAAPGYTKTLGGSGWVVDPIPPRANAGALLPVNSVLVTAGDSIVAGFVGGTPPYDKAFDSAGYVYYALQYASHRLRVPHNGQLAVSGYNLTQIRDSLGYPSGASLNALLPTVVLNNGGTNELSTQTLANMLTTEGQIRTLALASGARYVRVGITPRFGANALSVADELKRQQFNSAIRTICEADPTRQTYIDVDLCGLTSTDFTDGLHPNYIGARKIGAALGVAFAGLVSAGSIIDAAYLDLYTLNPTFAGGTTTAPNWTLSQTSGATVNGMTVTASKDGSDRQRLLISGTPTGSSQSISLDQYTNVTAVGKTPPAGSIFEAVSEFEIVDAPNVNTISFLYGTSTSGFANLARGQRLLPNYTASIAEIGAGVYRTRCPVVIMASGAPNYIDGRCIITFNNGVANNLDIRLSHHSMRRIA